MLELLRVRTFAIIEELEVHFGPGFNVLTGETGAGKTILVDALHLVLGGRALSDSVRTGAEEAEVQALFRPRDPAECDARLQALGLPAAGAELVVRRTVQRAGRSRARGNGVLAAAEKLRAGAQEAEALLAESGAARAAKRLEEMALIDPALQKLAQSVRGAAVEVNEAARELARYGSRAGGDPRRLEDIDERLEGLRKISRKHGGSLPAAPQRRGAEKEGAGAPGEADAE